MLFSIGHFIKPEPVPRGVQQTGEMHVHVVNRVQLRGERVGHVYDYDFPVRLARVDQTQNAQGLDLFDRPRGDDAAFATTIIVSSWAYLACVEGIVVALVVSCRGIAVGGIFPRLSDPPPKLC